MSILLNVLEGGMGETSAKEVSPISKHKSNYLSKLTSKTKQQCGDEAEGDAEPLGAGEAFAEEEDGGEGGKYQAAAVYYGEEDGACDYA